MVLQLSSYPYLQRFRSWLIIYKCVALIQPAASLNRCRL